MAAVYTLGKSEGTVISNNVTHHVHAYSYGCWGLYTDEGSSGILMENNLVYYTKTGGFHQHYGENNTVKNNIIIFKGGVVLKGPWNKINIEMDQNIYWNLTGNTYSFNDQSFENW